MINHSDRFDLLQDGDNRPLTWAVRFSFDKAFDEDIKFFTLDESVLDGPDVLAPEEDSPVIKQWDKYSYLPYEDRVLQVEITREETLPYSITRAYADVTLKNEDDFFTPGSGSPIDEFILPKRPARLLLGFERENLPLFIGLTEKMPEIDRTGRTATFHMIDFLSFLYDKRIDEDILLQSSDTATILEHLLQNLGLLPGQYVLDPAFNTVPFFFAESGSRFGPIAEKLMEAEIGRLFMDETGTIVFKNRLNQEFVSMLLLDRVNTIDYQIPSEDYLINSVNIHNDVRVVQPNQSIWTTGQPVQINVGQTVEVWADFTDPVTGANDPVYSNTEINDSYFSSHLEETADTPYTGINFVSMDLFSKSAKLTFTNSGGSNAFLTIVDIFGTPAKIVDKIIVEADDEESIAKYDEQPYDIDTEYFQSEGNATARATQILQQFAEYGNVIDIEWKGHQALQVGDLVTVDLDGLSGVFQIFKITNIYEGSDREARFVQRLRVRFAFEDLPECFFTLDHSEFGVLDGDCVLAPPTN